MNDNQTIELVKIRKVTIKGYEVKPTFITNIEIYESITKPGITGYMDIQDYQSLQELGNIFADDEIIITIGVDDDQANELNLKFKIFTNEGSRQIALNTYDYLKLGFCSPWLVDGLVKYISKPYEDKLVSDIVKDLLLECGAEIGYIEPTKTKLETFVSPFWTPYHIIKHLLSFAINENGVGGYLCYTDLKTGKVNVNTMDYMLKGTLGKYESFEVNSANIRYSGRVKSMSIESSYDTIRVVNTGSPITKHYGFNFDTLEVITTKKTIKDDKQTRLGVKFPLLNKYNKDVYATHKVSALFPQTAKPITNEPTKMTDLLEGLESNTYSMLTSDIMKINIETLGETKRRVGWLAKLNYPSVENDTGLAGNSTGQKQLIGYYLIRDIKHEFSLYQDYNQYITLISDGFKESTLDLISWSK